MKECIIQTNFFEKKHLNSNLNKMNEYKPKINKS